MGPQNDAVDLSEVEKSITSMSLEGLSKYKIGRRTTPKETSGSTAESSKLKGDEFVGVSERRRTSNDKPKFVPLKKPGRPAPSSVPQQNLKPKAITTTYATMSAEEAKLLEPMDPKAAGWSKPIDPIKLREAAISAPKINIEPVKSVHSRSTFNGKVYKSRPAGGSVSDTLTEQINELAKEAEREKYRDDADFSVKGLVPKLLPHQRVGVMFMMRRENPADESKLTNAILSAKEAEKFKVNKIRGGLLCDDMGLGKTVQGLALILANPPPKNKDARCTLVIAPLAVLWQWVEEAQSKAPSLKIGVHHSSATGGMRVKDPKGLDVVVTTYETVRSDADKGGLTAANKWYRVICDEGHTFRTPTSQLFAAVVKLKATNRWIFTGTPINNNTMDLFSYFRFLHLVDPEAGDWASFSSSRTEIGNFVLRNAFQAVSMRRRQNILGNILPGCTRVRKELKLSSTEKDLYEEMILKSKLESDHLALLTRLRQLCSDYRTIADLKEGLKNDLADTDETKLEPTEPLNASVASSDPGADLDLDMSALSSGLGAISLDKKVKVDRSKWGSKTRALADMIEAEPKRKTVVFSSFVQTLKLCGSALGELGINYRIYDGSMSAKKRTNVLTDFRNDESCVVLLCSLKATAVGINITCASRVIIIEPWWNPMITDQAINRVYRLGQKSHVDVVELGASRTIETLIFRLQDTKRRLSDEIVEDEEMSSTDAMAIIKKALASVGE